MSLHGNSLVPGERTSRAFLQILIGFSVLTGLAIWLKVHFSNARGKSGGPQDETPTAQATNLEAAPPRKSVHIVKPLTGRPAALAAEKSDSDSQVFSTLSEFTSPGAAPQRGDRKSYRVSEPDSTQLRMDITAIGDATNILGRLKQDILSTWQAYQKDTSDYLEKLKNVDATGQDVRAKMAKQLLDMQSLYFERKRQYETEMSSARMSFQDPIPILDQKLTFSQQASEAYKNDLHQLEAAIYELQQKLFVESQQQRDVTSQLGLAYKQAAQDHLSTLNSLKAQFQNEVVEANNLIRAYNARLRRVGTVEL